MLKIKISGYYHSGKSDVDFNKEVTMPDCSEEHIQSNVMYRIVPMVFATSSKPYSANGVCYVDKVTKDDRIKPSYNGKNIKDMEWEDIEFVAIAYNLRSVPLYRACSLREARERLYKEYSKVVNGYDCEEDANYRFEEAKDIIIGQAEVEVSNTTKAKKGQATAEPVQDGFDEQVDSLKKEFAEA